MVRKPKRFDDYIDASIAPQYFEDEFLEFKDVMQRTGNFILEHNNSEQSNSEKLLQNFHKFEDFRQRQSLVIRRQNKVI